MHGSGLADIVLTHRGRYKMAAILQMALSNAFSWMKMYEFQFKAFLKFVPKGPIANTASLIQVMAKQATSLYLNHW